MSIEKKINKYMTLIAWKVEDIERRLNLLDTDKEASKHLDLILPIVDKLGCCPPKFCLPKSCDGKLGSSLNFGSNLVSETNPDDLIKTDGDLSNIVIQ